MGEGVSPSLPQKGFPVGHSLEVSNPFARELGLSQISSLRCLEEIDSLCHKKDPILLFGFRSQFFPVHRDAAGLSSVVDVTHRVFLG